MKDSTVVKDLNVIPDLERVFYAFCRARHVGESRASLMAFGGGHRAADIFGAGSKISVQAVNDALQRMSDEWPKEHDSQWPKDVKRPARSGPAKYPPRPEPVFAR
jgi:hypothetical protein